MFPCTIDKELHKAWVKLTRRGDTARMAENFGYSKPTIEKCILYGHVNNSELADMINAYFRDRLISEHKAAAELLELDATLSPRNRNYLIKLFKQHGISTIK